MNQQAAQWIDTVVTWAILLTSLLIPFLFWNMTSDFYETPKLLGLIAVTGILLVLWGVRCILDGKVTLTRTPVDIPLILMIIVLVVSTFFAVSKPVAILGNIPRVHGGLVSFLLYILFYFALVSNIKKVVTVRQIVYLLTGSTVVLSALSLLSYSGVVLFNLPGANLPNFTPTGSSFSTTALIALALPFPLVAILKATSSEIQEISRSAHLKNLLGGISLKSFLSLILTLMIACVVLTGTMATYVASAASLLLVLLITPQSQVKKNSVFILFPIVIGVALAILSFAPIPATKTEAYDRAQTFPRELQLSFPISWKVSVSAFRDAPFWGSGPATYLTDFTKYRPIEFNNTPLWNTRFDSAFNEYLQFLATLGGPGLLSLVLLTVVQLSLAFRALRSDQSVLGISLAISSIVFFLMLLLHTSTLVLWAAGALILSSFMIIHRPVTDTLHIGIAAARDFSNQLNLKFDALPEVLLVLILVGVGGAFYFTSKYAIADYHHRLALNAVNTGQGLEVYNQLLVAERLNPYADIYRTDLAQTNFALANSIAINKGPTEASPGGSLTDQDRQNIQTLLSQAIAEGRASTVLNPNNPLNWELLGSIYRQISGVAQNALLFSLDSYGRSVALDPLNPQLRLIIGGIYYSAQNYDLAIRFFSDAVNLKPDLANGYYNLAVALRDKGDLTSAITSAERTVSLLDPNSQDYKAASEFLADLKSRSEEATKATPPAPIGSGPAAETTSALQNKSLPQVLDLPKPESIATPEAIKKPTPTPTQ